MNLILEMEIGITGGVEDLLLRSGNESIRGHYRKQQQSWVLWVEQKLREVLVLTPSNLTH